MVGDIDVGQHQTLTRKLTRALATTAIVGTLALGAWAMAGSSSQAGGDTRTISLYQVHTKERLTVTYKVNGRYVPSAMKKINHLLRDWRRNEVITIDPRTIDLVWETHADLGSKAPIHIVSGYRSPKTNAFLKRIGRKVAKTSQHMKGKAIDFFFPDVPTKKIRNVALAHRLGGVGYYSSAGGPTGFIHADSGRVRSWGPGMRGAQVAGYIKEGKKVLGRHSGRKVWSDSLVASADSGAEAGEKKSGGLLSLFTGGKKKKQAEVPAEAQEVAPSLEDTVAPPAPLEAAYGDSDEELADLSADAAAAQKASDRKKLKLKEPTPVADELFGDEDGQAQTAELAPAKPAAKAGAKPGLGDVANGQLAALADSASVGPEVVEPAAATAKDSGRKVPRPRLKPQAVFDLAEAKALEDAGNLKITPASAPPESQTRVRKPSQVTDALANLDDSETTIEGPVQDASAANPVSGIANQDGKSNLADGSEDDIVIKPVVAALSGAEPSWWSFLSPDVSNDLRRNGMPAELDSVKSDILPVAVSLGPDGTGPATTISVESDESGKGDAQAVNREGKGNLPTAVLRLSSRDSDAENNTALQ